MKHVKLDELFTSDEIDEDVSCEVCNRKNCFRYPDWGVGAVLYANTCPYFIKQNVETD